MWNVTVRCCVVLKMPLSQCFYTLTPSQVRYMERAMLFISHRAKLAYWHSREGCLICWWWLCLSWGLLPCPQESRHPFWPWQRSECKHSWTHSLEWWGLCPESSPEEVCHTTLCLLQWACTVWCTPLMPVHLWPLPLYLKLSAKILMPSKLYPSIFKYTNVFLNIKLYI